jgi:hypothetical protein
MTLVQFKSQFARIRSRGFIRSARSGPTGIGHTLEKVLGLQENNLAIPDLGEVELKAHRENASSLITLFTFNRKAWVMKPLDAVRKHGTLDANGRKGLYFTMSRTPNSSGLFLEITDQSVWVQHTSGVSLVDRLPRYVGHAWRAESGYRHPIGTTAADVVRFERNELDNDWPDHVPPALLRELAHFSARDLVWVARTEEIAGRYGFPVLLDLSDNARVVHEDEDGVLVLNLTETGGR